MPDAVVIGAGPNGLVAANLLADAGWDVEVLEAQPEPGGAVRSGELTLPGFVHDRFSSFYPLSAASPTIRAMGLEEHGLRWRRHRIAVAHPAADGSCPYVAPEDREGGIASVGPADAAAWRRLLDLWDDVGPSLLASLFTPFPPVRAGGRMLRAIGPDRLLDFARFGLLGVRRFADEEFTGPAAGRLLAGNALHADLSPEQSGGALFGLVLVGTAQSVGWPYPEGGSGRLTDALVARLTAAGGRVTCGRRVSGVLVRGGRAVGVRTADGDEVLASRAVLADVTAPSLYLDLLPDGAVPPTVLRAMRRFHVDNATFKVDWALREPIPWTAPEAREAGTIHVTEGMDALTRHSAELAQGLVPATPFLLLGQHALGDPSRVPEPGQEVVWAYTHVPQQVRGDAGDGGLTGRWDAAECERFADRMEAEVERLAPGFRDRILARCIQGPHELEAENANLRLGGLNGGTAQLHQQLVFRPIPGLGRSETPIPGLYLASASAHPGGGVHGACGANAARAALRQGRTTQRLMARLTALPARPLL